MSVTDNKRNFTKSRVLLTGLLVLSLFVAPVLSSFNAHAASLGKAMVRFDHMKISTPTAGTICAISPSATGQVETSVQVVFPTGYTLGAAGTFLVDTTQTATWPAGGTAWIGIGTASSVVTSTVTFPSGNLTSNTDLYCFNWTSTAAVTTHATPGTSYLGSITTYIGGSPIDTEQYATAAISNDEILVTATVPAIFSFSLSGNDDLLAGLSTSSVKVSPTPRFATISTNATNGWVVWAKDANAGLLSASASYNIATNPGVNSTLVAGTTGYNTGVTTAAPTLGPTPTIAAPFIGSGLYQGGGLDATLRTIATSPSPNQAAILTLTNNVAISTVVPAAADYTDTISVIGAGMF